MGRCERCQYYNKEYDEARQQFDDVIRIGDDTVKHHCIMYLGQIPNGIYYDGKECLYYEEKGAE